MGKVIGFELSSQDPQKAAEFYSAVFGWEIKEQPWEYWSISTESKNETAGIIGGISKGPKDFPHGTRIQILVDSIDETISKAKDKGAMVVRERMEFDQFYLAYLVDPTGLGFGLIENK